MIDDATETESDAEEFGLLDHLEVTRRLEEELDAYEIAFAMTNERLRAFAGHTTNLRRHHGGYICRATGNKRKRSQT